MPNNKYYLTTTFRVRNSDGNVIIADPLRAEYTDLRKAESAYYTKVGNCLAELTMTQFAVTLCDELQNPLLTKSWVEDEVTEV